MGLSYVKLFFSFREDIALLTMEERGRLVTAMLEYAETGALPGDSLTGNERFLFPVCRQRIDRDVESYERTVEARRANGAKGGRPRKNLKVFLETEKSQEEDKEEEKEKEKDKGEDKERASGDAPTLEEVVACCKQEAPSVDGERFWSYYQAVGWRTGGQPIVDWRAKLKEWDRGNRTGDRVDRAPAPAEKGSALNYLQREWSDESQRSFLERCERGMGEE